MRLMRVWVSVFVWLDVFRWILFQASWSFVEVDFVSGRSVLEGGAVQVLCLVMKFRLRQYSDSVGRSGKVVECCGSAEKWSIVVHMFCFSTLLI